MQRSLLEGLTAQHKPTLSARKLSACLQKHPGHHIGSRRGCHDNPGPGLEPPPLPPNMSTQHRLRPTSEEPGLSEPQKLCFVVKREHMALLLCLSTQLHKLRAPGGLRTLCWERVGNDGDNRPPKAVAGNDQPWGPWETR